MKKKKNKYLKIRFKFIFFLFIAVSIVFIAWYFVVEREVFNLRSITVEGLHSYDEEYFLKEVEIELGMNIFFINEKRINRDVEEMLRIREVEVQRNLPDRVSIRVEERAGQFLLNYGGNFFLIDTDGIIFDKAQDAKEYDLPCLVDEMYGEVELGKGISEGDAFFLFSLLKKMPATTLKNISEVSYINGDVVMYTVNGVKVLWGDDAENFQVKLKVFEKLPAIAEDYGNVEYIDIRYGDNPIIKTLESGD